MFPLTASATKNGVFTHVLTACNAARLFRLFATSPGWAIFLWLFSFAIWVVISVGVPINAQLPWRKRKNEQRFQNKQISNLFGYHSNSCHGTMTFPLVVKIEVSRVYQQTLARSRVVHCSNNLCTLNYFTV